MRTIIIGAAAMAVFAHLASPRASAHEGAFTPTGALPTYADSRDGAERTYVLLPPCVEPQSVRYDPATRWLTFEYVDDCATP